jgi:Zn-dependent protease
MSWRDDDGADGPLGRSGRPGGDWQGLRPSFDNPLSWSLPILRVAGITVRVHVLFLLFIIIVLLRALASPDRDDASTLLDVRLVAAGLACLFTIVLMHEFGHCLACRWSGGEASEILMWPLGGLAFCRPRPRWSSHLATAVGGPAVNVVFCTVATILLVVQVQDRPGVTLANPLRVYAALAGLNDSWPLTILYLVNWCSLVLLAFNLVPVFPLDGGRILQAVLWRRLGYAASMRLSVRIGYVGAIALGLLGVFIHWAVIAVACFGGIVCYLTHRQLEFTEWLMDEDGEGVLVPDGDDPSSAGRSIRRERQARRRAAIEAEEEQQVDAILQKIAEAGMASLSARERRLLRRVTERRRRR